ncbi:MAG: glutathione S-transferase [Pseudomonadota bacterium]
MSNTAPSQPIKLHRMRLSGHCHRVELFLSLLGLPYETVDVNLGQREHKSPGFLRMNPFGQVPAIEDGEVTLGDSNAILVYLASRYAPGEWLPTDPLGAARVQRWLSAAAGPLAFGPNMARAMVLFKREGDPAPMVERSHQLLAVMEQELAQQPFLAGERPTLADIAHYSYVARAPEGFVSLEPYPAVRAWLERIEALPRFVPFARSAVGLSA